MSLKESTVDAERDGPRRPAPDAEGVLTRSDPATADELDQALDLDKARTRDRDAAGRARQARPRDALGRPLAYGEVGVEPVSEEPLPAAETIEAAWSLLNEGRPFAAHEVLEARWKAAPEHERDLWQGLAQLCVGLTHAARGNIVGAQRLVDRGAGRLAAYAVTDGDRYGLDLDALTACARDKLG
jgi:hypothetical protein